MKSKTSKVFYALTSNSKRLFLVDGLGAFITAFLLFVIMGTMSEYFGMPESVLMILAVIASVFCIFSISCFFFVNGNKKPYLKAIGIANLAYCCLTLALIVYFYPQLTLLGLSYFLLEIVIISGLAYIEINVA
ncbi:hypothetical protein ACFSKL_02145 [Belliella marina]|uniref:Uncharacterized protein n=1 Tax=Belliella marina TaxID=1644146 RepID=A0ABW4VHN8_9BACT